ncbi:MAG: hypothetical protein HZA07_06695 [Nitrospirae bacterium]|nr:hypothetical protein [Nitrospirota bacterium]
MKTLIVIITFVTTFIISSSLTHAVEPAPKITDREIIEGLSGIRGDIIL